MLLGLFPTHDFYWANPSTGTPKIGPLFDHGLSLMRVYLATRERISVIGFPWGRIAIGNLAVQWKRLKSLRERRTIEMHMWDKGFHGRNQAKAGELTQAQCYLCRAGANDQAHFLLECQAYTLVVLRAVSMKTDNVCCYLLY